MISKLSNISFKSTPIYDVKVKKKDGSDYIKADAVFSILNADDKEDREAILKVQESWEGAKYTPNISYNFKTKKKQKFYAIELKGSEPLSERIVTLADVERPFCNMSFLQFLQSKPDFKKDRFIKGGGEVMLYGIVRETKKQDLDRVELCATDKSINFYRHLGFKQDDPNDPTELILKNKDFDSFIKRVEGKYDFSSQGEEK